MMISKAYRTCGVIKRAIGFNAPAKVKLQLFKSLCMSILDYCSSVWSPHSKVLIKKMEHIQRSMNRYIVNDPANDLSYTERCMNLQLLPLSYRREINDLLLVFKALFGPLHGVFTNEISYCNSSHNLSSLNHGARTETFISSFFHRIVQLYNILPLSVRNANSLSAFKLKLFNHYFDKLAQYDITNSCTLTSLCRCQGFPH